MIAQLRTILLAGFTASLAVSNATGEEPVGVVVEKVKGSQPTRIRLESRFLKLPFDPARGGRCSRLLIRTTGEQVIGDDDVAGMFLEHFVSEGIPWAHIDIAGPCFTDKPTGGGTSSGCTSGGAPSWPVGLALLLVGIGFVRRRRVSA